MKLYSTKVWALLLLVLSYGAFAQEEEKEETDSTDLFWDDDDVNLAETVIVGGGLIDLEEDRATPVAVSTVTKREIQTRAQGNVDFVDVLKYTPSFYIDNGGGGFGDSQAFVRGFDDRNTAYMLNGQPINGMEDGRMYWSNWAGMAEFANVVQIQRGLGSSKLAISSVGGTVNIVTKATERRKGGSVGLVMGNDSYYKAIAQYNTGMSESGWGLSVGFSHWAAHRNYFRGTFGEGQNYFLSVGKKAGDHTFNFLIFGSPQQHGQRWSQSLDQIAEDPKFNQHWGYTSGGDGVNYFDSEIESERTNFYHKPVANFTWDWEISDATDLSTTLYGSWGRGGGSGPRGEGRVRTADGQVDYAGIIQRNLADPDGIGNSGDYLILPGEDDILGTADDVDGNYIRRGSMNNHQWYGALSNLNHEFNENLSINFGADFRFYRGDHFRQILDLYGLQEWTGDRPDGRAVTETFDINPWAMVFDFADEDERIDYDYSENINYQGGFGQIEYKNDDFSVYFQGAISNQSYVREGRFTDVGDSETVNKLGYNLKGGAAYFFNEHNSIYGNAGFYSRQPFLDNIFADIRGSNALIEPEIDNEEITGLELGYRYKKRGLRVSVDLYRTEWANRFLTFSNGEDDPALFREYLLTGVTQLHQGVEVSFNAKVTRKWNVRGFISAGDWSFDGSSPYRTRDDNGDFITGQDPTTGLAGEGEFNMDAKVPQAAQFTASFGTQFEIVRGLNIFSDMRYAAQNYDATDFIDRLNDATITNSQIQESTLQPYVLVDGGLSYNFDVFGQNMTFVGNVMNLFNESVIINSNNFGYFNAPGRIWNASLTWNF